MARQKARTKKDRDLEFLREIAVTNTVAKKDGPRKKTYSLHNLKSIRPMTENQRMFFESYMQGNNVVGSGSAGTGKSYIALFLALNDILDPDALQDRIIIVRSAVPSREIGHLPGTAEEKMAVYEEPYKAICGDLLRSAKAYDELKEARKIEFMPTSFVRGLTWDNAIVVIDEAQSMTWHEVNSVVTRVGKNTKVVILGDVAQNDLLVRKNDLSGFLQVLEVAKRMEEFDIITFTPQDIVRSAFAKSWLLAVESL